MKAQQPNTEWTEFHSPTTTCYRRRYPNGDHALVDDYTTSDDGGHTVALWRWRYDRWNGVSYSGIDAAPNFARQALDRLQESFATGERTPASTTEGEHFTHTGVED